VPEITTLKLAELTGLDRATVRKRLIGAPFRREGENEKLPKYYDSTKVLTVVSFGDKDLTPQDALAVKRTEEIELDMQTKRKERIPLDDIQDVDREVFANVCGLLKSNVGKVLTEDMVTDMLAQFREIGVKIREKSDVGFTE
jgi:hypothetical protein